MCVCVCVPDLEVVVMFWLSSSTTYDRPEITHTHPLKHTTLHIGRKLVNAVPTHLFTFAIMIASIASRFVFLFLLLKSCTFERALYIRFHFFFLSSRFQIKGVQAGREMTSLFHQVPIGTGSLTFSIYSIH